jgi:NTP pyrophosphatase (non-canonical NTP hydrolase)
MVNFTENGTIADFQQLAVEVYSEKDDRLYSTPDLVVQIQRFMMRALKGIRKNDNAMLKMNLVISLAWFMALCNRLHIDIEEEVWKRFPYVCSYCAKKPCICRKSRPEKRIFTKPDQQLRPKTMRDFQRMHEEIYPSENQTIFEVGVHAGEEVGEIAEAIHNYLSQHKDGLFEEVRLELADFISCLFDVANLINMNLAKELSEMFKEGCHVCHNVPCICTFEEVADFKI